MKKWDVVIIGSGISGLICAAFLAKRGKSVCVLERHSKPGGYLHCFNRFGCRFETGGHYVGGLGEGQPFQTVLSYLGVDCESLFVPLDEKAFEVIQFPSFRVEMPAGYEAVLEVLSHQFPSERKGIHCYLDRIRLVAGRFPTYAFQEEMDTAAVLESLNLPLKTVVEEVTSNRQLQSVLYSSCIKHGVAPADFSFGFHALITDSFIRGPYGFRKGGQALAESLIQIIESQGGKVLTRTGVDRLVTEKRSIQHVETSTGERVDGEWIISCAHPKTTFRLVDGEPLKPAFQFRLDRLAESMGILGVYAKVSDLSPFQSKRNYYFFGSEDPDQLLSVGGAMDPPPAVYVAPSRMVENEDAPSLTFHAPAQYEWFQPWEGTVVKKRPPEYYAFKQKLAQNTIDFVERFYPGGTKAIESFDSSSPLTNLHYNGSEKGSGYGIYHSRETTGVKALGPRTHIRNLLLTGQSCLVPGIMGAAIAGLRTAGHVVGLKSLIRDLIKEKGIQ